MATKKTAEKSPAKAPGKAAAKSTPAKSAAKKASAKSASEASSPVKGKSTPTHREIAELAHKYYTERGHGHHGKHVDDWIRAEKELSK